MAAFQSRSEAAQGSARHLPQLANSPASAEHLDAQLGDLVEISLPIAGHMSVEQRLCQLDGCGGGQGVRSGHFALPGGAVGRGP
ncbi:hypothetical protein KZO11_38250 [Streptomyces anulatus]|uniref:hypothetical protein n=1 Tax=Streptomyces anulatus TaxID=1892 RepID=UPI001C5DBBD4|nr:hypothetical protein [Streptomyces anulatus]QYA98982.1 hypothetical protein KZO11_38250 [Streptomyces anulatus]